MPQVPLRRALEAIVGFLWTTLSITKSEGVADGTRTRDHQIHNLDKNTVNKGLRGSCCSPRCSNQDSSLTGP